MIRYEIKKVLGSTGGKVALAVFSALVVLSCYLSVGKLEWVNENGDYVYGLAAVKPLREARNHWEGPLDEEKLKAVILENQRILATPQYNSAEIQQKNIAYSWRQGIAPIRLMMCFSYADGLRDYNYYTADSVSPSDAGAFYSNRVKLLRQYLYDETNDAFNAYSEREKQYLIAKYENLETPFYFDYCEGWSRLLDNCMYILGWGTLMLGFLTAGIFSNEFKWKADTVFFSSRYGRSKAIKAKIQAGFLWVTVLYWAAIGVYTLVTLCCLGFEGGNCPIQIANQGLNCRSFYNLTFWQTWLLTAVGGYIGNLFFAALTMFVSAKSRSAALAVTVPLLLILVPNTGNWPLSSKQMGLLPDQLLQLQEVIGRYFNVYEIGGKVFNAVTVLPLLYGALTIALVPLMYRAFRKRRLS